MKGQRRWVRFLPTIAMVTVVGVVVIGLFVVISDFIDSPKSNKKVAQQISLITPPAPPLPPPEKIEKPPEPEIEEVKIEEPVPEDVPEVPSDEPPIGDLLGLDVDGMGGADGFGLLGKKGARSLLGSGGDRFAYYGNTVTQMIQEFLYDRGDFRRKAFSVKVKLWIDVSGKIEKVELLNSTGDRTVDKSLQVALMEMGEISDKPPEGLPQPVRVRITSRI